MNLRKLETFYWAAKLGSFTAAADRLNATQSTVSMRISELERELGIELFDRSQRTARITVIGRQMMRYVEDLLATYAEMTERIAAGDSTPGTLRVGVAEVISLTWLPSFVSKVHDCYPKLRIELDEALTKSLVQDLEGGKLDMVLAPGRVAGYEQNEVALGDVTFRWAAAPGLEMPDGPLSPRALAQSPVIALGRDSYHHMSIENWFKAGNARCRRIDVCKSMGVAASLAASGLGVTLLPLPCFAEDFQNNRLRAIEVDPPFPPIPFTATFAAGSFNPVTQRIAELARGVSTFDNID